MLNQIDSTSTIAVKDPATTPPPTRYVVMHPRVRVTVPSDTGMRHVILSAYNEFDRIHRLATVAARLPGAILGKLTELHDHKGMLAVNWRKLPTASDIAEVHRAWEEQYEP